MKKCNNCGYPGLDDSSRVCPCGSYEKPSLFSSILLSILFVAIEVLLLAFVFAVISLNENFNTLKNIFMDDTLPFIALSLFIANIILYYIVTYFKIKKIKNKGGRATTFSTVEPSSLLSKGPHLERANSEQKTICECKKDDRLFSGILIGVIAACIFGS